MITLWIGFERRPRVLAKYAICAQKETSQSIVYMLVSLVINICFSWVPSRIVFIVSDVYSVIGKL